SVWPRYDQPPLVESYECDYRPLRGSHSDPTTLRGRPAMNPESDNIKYVLIHAARARIKRERESLIAELRCRLVLAESNAAAARLLRDRASTPQAVACYKRCLQTFLEEAARLRERIQATEQRLV